jgi:hypothetical protein
VNEFFWETETLRAPKPPVRFKKRVVSGFTLATTVGSYKYPRSFGGAVLLFASFTELRLVCPFASENASYSLRVDLTPASYTFASGISFLLAYLVFSLCMISVHVFFFLFLFSCFSKFHCHFRWRLR